MNNLWCLHGNIYQSAISKPIGKVRDFDLVWIVVTLFLTDSERVTLPSIILLHNNLISQILLTESERATTISWLWHVSRISHCVKVIGLYFDWQICIPTHFRVFFRVKCAPNFTITYFSSSLHQTSSFELLCA